jgi:hypothetical protein
MQSRLRISAPFYLIFTKCHFATPIARIYIILFNFQYVTSQPPLRVSISFYLILWNADHAIPFAYLCTILFNFHKMPFRNPHCAYLYHSI